MSRYFFYTVTVSGVFLTVCNGDTGADREGHAVDQGIRAPLLESRIGGKACFSRLEYFLDRHCIVVLARYENEPFPF